MATRKKKRTLVSYKDVQLAYLLEGVDAVARQWRTGNVSKSTVRRAVKKLQEANEEVAKLERWVVENVGPIGRGRSAPQAGETRSYKAQQIGDGGPFLRLPLDSLGVRKTDFVRVHFEDERIIVTR
jgi:hypothetical protein